MDDNSAADAASTSVSSLESNSGHSNAAASSSRGGNPAAAGTGAAGARMNLPPPPPPPKMAVTSPFDPEKSYMELEAWLSKLTTGTPLTESEVKTLTEMARERLLQESNVQPVSAPVTICGDIHVSSGLYSHILDGEYHGIAPCNAVQFKF